MTRDRLFLILGSAAVLLYGCSLFGPESGLVIDNKARLETAASSRSMLPRTVAQDSSRAVSGFRSTPESISGDLAWAFLSLGDLGPGMFPMTWLAPEDSFPETPESGSVSNVVFDLADPVTISAKVLIPASASDMPERQEILRAELNFNYVDTTFVLGDQTYTVRTVYTTSFTATDVEGTMRRGDKLIRLPGETDFKWADNNGVYLTRVDASDGPYQDSTVTGYVQPPEGNQDYIPVTANFPQSLPVDWDTLADTGKTWTLSFILENAIVWTVAPDTLTTPQAILDAFRLKFGPNQSTTYGEEDDGIRATLSIN